LKQAIQVLNDLKREGVIAEYAIGGAIAALFYTEPVLTQDLDVFVLSAAPTAGKLITLKPLYVALRSRGYREQREYVVIDGCLVQFLPAAGDLLEEAIREASDRQYERTPVRVLRPEHLIAIALQTCRPKDRARVALLVEQAQMDNDYLHSVLKRYRLEGKFKEWAK